MSATNEITVIIPEIKEVDAKYCKDGFFSFETAIEHNQESEMKESYQIDDSPYGRYRITFTKDIVHPIEIKYCGYPLTIVK